ncbi:thiol-disulfide oxidoreductase DCC family protein [Pseudomonas entomophila]|uniref:thiol-disulfide oxidoreductase DCC family protein n=1 Tax=Pseudomonas entomophila TaxID=312306 RepID=UPI003EBF0829
MPVPERRPTPAPLLRPGETVVLYDGVCKLCNGVVHFLLRNDPQASLRLATVQSPEGQALLAWAGLPRQHFNTVAVIRDDQLWVRSDAFFELVPRLSRRWHWLSVLQYVPKAVRDAVYDLVARHRYRWFGRYDRCQLPSARDQARFLDAGRHAPGDRPDARAPD